MTILITGATGKTGSCLAQLCKQADHSVLLTSRSGSVPEPFQGVRFEWLEPSTHENPFKIDGNIDRVYLVGPPMQNALPPMKEFIELALQKGVKRFVLLSGTASQKGSPGTGEIHKYLAERGGVEYAVLRPSWFFRRRSTWSETFSTDLRPGILNGDAIVSTTKDGRVPFVSVEDVADVAYKALVEEIPRNGEYIIVGPEIHSYDEVAALMSEVIGRQITHKRLSAEDGKALWLSSGTDDDYACAILAMEKKIAIGEEEAYFDLETNVVGWRRLAEFFKTNWEVWVRG